MPLPAGTELGTHKILSLIGIGGMGEVYKAHGTKRRRDVAIKILPESFARDADRLARSFRSTGSPTLEKTPTTFPYNPRETPPGLGWTSGLRVPANAKPQADSVEADRTRYPRLIMA